MGLTVHPIYDNLRVELVACCWNYVILSVTILSYSIFVQKIKKYVDSKNLNE